MKEGLRGKSLFDIAAFAVRATRREPKAPAPLTSIVDYNTAISEKRFLSSSDPKIAELEHVCENLRRQMEEKERSSFQMEERFRAFHAEVSRLNGVTQQLSSFSSGLESKLRQLDKSTTDNGKKALFIEDKTAKLIDELKEAILALGQRTLFLEDRCGEALKVAARAEDFSVKVVHELEERFQRIMEMEKGERLRAEQQLMERMGNQVQRLWETTEGAVKGLQAIDHRQKQAEAQNNVLNHRIELCEQRVLEGVEVSRSAHQTCKNTMENQQRLIESDCSKREQKMVDLCARIDDILREEVDARISADQQLKEFSRTTVEGIHRELRVLQESNQEARQAISHIQVHLSENQQRKSETQQMAALHQLKNQFQTLEQRVSIAHQEVRDRLDHLSPFVCQQESFASDLRKVEKEVGEQKEHIKCWMQNYENKIAVINQADNTGVVELRHELRNFDKKLENCAHFSLQGLQKVEAEYLSAIEKLSSGVELLTKKFNDILPAVAASASAIGDLEFGVEAALQTIVLVYNDNQRQLKEHRAACYETLQQRKIPPGVTALARCVRVSCRIMKNLGCITHDVLSAIHMEHYGVRKAIHTLRSDEHRLECKSADEHSRQKEEFYALNKDFQFLIGCLKTTHSNSSLFAGPQPSIEQYAL